MINTKLSDKERAYQVLRGFRYLEYFAPERYRIKTIKVRRFLDWETVRLLCQEKIKGTWYVMDQIETARRLK